MSTRTRPTSGTGAGGRTATLLSSASDEATTSLLPGLLSITLSASPLVLGVVEGVAGAVDGLARLGGGALAEDPRRRRYISVGSYAVMTALTGLIAAAASGVQVGALRAGSAAARGLRSPQRYASVPERAGSSGYGRVFGFERSLHHLAAVAGPALAFAALTLVGLRPALLAAALPGVAAVVIGVVLLRRAPAAGPAPAAQRPRLQVRAVYQGRIGSLMAGITLFELANFAAVLLILRATKLLEVQDVPFGAAAMAVLLYLLWRLASAPRNRSGSVSGTAGPPATSTTRSATRTQNSCRSMVSSGPALPDDQRLPRACRRDRRRGARPRRGPDPDGATVFTRASETLRLSGIEHDITVSSRNQAIKPRILAMDRAAHADEIRHLCATPTSSSAASPPSPRPAPS